MKHENAVQLIELFIEEIQNTEESCLTLITSKPERKMNEIFKLKQKIPDHVISFT